jgi:hypothetical protein
MILEPLPLLIALGKANGAEEIGRGEITLDESSVGDPG